MTVFMRSRGSPPPMRGKAYDFSRKKFVVRITPAYAGKSFGMLLIARSIWDHPRLCGEKSKRLKDFGL